MNWKELFKPSVSKIILFIILALISPLAFLFGFGTICPIVGSCHMILSPITPIAVILLWPFLLILSTMGAWIESILIKLPLKMVYKEIIPFSLTLIINAIWLYILSCIIIFLIKKIRNR